MSWLPPGHAFPSPLIFSHEVWMRLDFIFSLRIDPDLWKPISIPLVTVIGSGAMRKTKSSDWARTGEKRVLPPGGDMCEGSRSEALEAIWLSRGHSEDRAMNIWKKTLQIGSLSPNQMAHPIFLLTDITGWGSCLPSSLLLPTRTPSTCDPTLTSS